MLAIALVSMAADEVRFSRDILPILSDRCFHCHGPDETHREADLRLDLRDVAVGDRGGYAAVVPGKPDESELINRVSSHDPNLQMPPGDSHRKPLSEQEINKLRRWIEAGAPWGTHWAFEKPERSAVADSAHPIDYFVERRLTEVGLKLSPGAAKRTLIRRLSFDLTGLPPTIDEVENFIADTSPGAYEHLVDRLLASLQYGERMAMWWLDAARYADTDGFQYDETRQNWPWRDWVIQSFNDNIPFNEFTVEQFAGDLQHNATPEQILATCFHRNHMTNGEGGRDLEESRIDYVIDRVNTMGTVWLGLTLGCCQCHSHKFDPLSQKDYYSLFAFFDSIDEDGSAGAKATPYLKYKPKNVDRAIAESQRVVDARRKVEIAARAKAKGEFEPWLLQQIGNTRQGFRPWLVLRSSALEAIEGTSLAEDPDGIIRASGDSPRHDDYRLVASPAIERITGIKLEIFPESAPNADGSGDHPSEFILTDVKLQVRRKGRSQLRDIQLAGAIADAERKVTNKDGTNDYGQVKDTLDDDPRNGWTVEPQDRNKPHIAVYSLASPLVLDADEQILFTLMHRSTRGNVSIRRFRVSVTDQPGEAVQTLDPMPLEELAATTVNKPDELNSQLRDRLLSQFLADHHSYQKDKLSLESAEQQLSEVARAKCDQEVMVLKERPTQRQSYILERGLWDSKGEMVVRSVPPAVLAWPADRTKTRLDLARWIVSKENPLTSRVVVNHLWQICFGVGLVRTPEDFGRQGEPPTHPELLDWLACELVDSGWDLKHVLRLIVTSRTYRQQSMVTPALLDCDPENLLLARGARHRLPSWMIRDSALHSSGLLNTALGGPPVMPYQPAGVWEELFMGRFRYEPSQGPAQFRRTIYAFWRRAIAPTFLFDNAQRRYCEVRSQHTNTPLQALTLLNDTTMLEASRELARNAISERTESTDRVALIFRRVLSRPPTADEAQILVRELEHSLNNYRNVPDDASVFLDFGQPEHRSSDSPVELASYLVVANMILNLDEAMTHE